MSPRRRHDRGFTLVELLVVITILGLLAGFVTVRVFEWVEEGRVTRARADIDTYEKGLALYRLNNRKYPTTNEGLEKLTEGTAKLPNGYIEKFNPNDPWDSPYIFESDGREYVIISYGADGQEGGEGNNADIANWDTEPL